MNIRKPEVNHFLFGLQERFQEMATLGEKIYKLRRNKGLTLEALAEAVGASKSSLWELENKPMARPAAERIEKLAKVLEVTTSFLLDDSQDEPSADVADKAFFREYEKLDEPNKKKLREILKVLDSKS